MKSRVFLSMCGLAPLLVGCAQSDAGITTAVKSQLAVNDVVQARQIDVDTRDRVVTLTGEVLTENEERTALEIARSTDGVLDVVDQVTVVDPGTAPVTGVGGTPAEPAAGLLTNDASITAIVKSKLLGDPDTSGLSIDVDTRDQSVTLTGRVESEAERQEALLIARSVDGVRSVTDRLTVGQP